jgi:hypothetical protein
VQIGEHSLHGAAVEGRGRGIEVARKAILHFLGKIGAVAVAGQKTRIGCRNAHKGDARLAGAAFEMTGGASEFVAHVLGGVLRSIVDNIVAEHDGFAHVFRRVLRLWRIELRFGCRACLQGCQRLRRRGLPHGSPVLEKGQRPRAKYQQNTGERQGVKQSAVVHGGSG